MKKTSRTAQNAARWRIQGFFSEFGIRETKPRPFSMIGSTRLITGIFILIMFGVPLSLLARLT